MKVLLLLPLLLCIDLSRSIKAESDRHHDNTVNKADSLKVKIRPYDPGKGERQIFRKINTRSVRSKGFKPISKKSKKRRSSNVKSTSKLKRNRPKKFNYNKANQKKVKSNHKRKKPGAAWIKVHPARGKGKPRGIKENSGGLLIYSRKYQNGNHKKEMESLCNTVNLVNEGEELIIQSDTNRNPVQCTAEFKGTNGITVGIQCGRFALHTGGCDKEELQVSTLEEGNHPMESSCKQPHCETFCGMYGPELESSSGFLKITYSRGQLKSNECSYGMVCSVYGGSAKPNMDELQEFSSCSGSCCLEKDYNQHPRSSKHSSIPLFVALLLFPKTSDVTDSQQPHSNNDIQPSFLPKKSPPPKIPPSPISCPAQALSLKGCGRSTPMQTRIVNGLDAYNGEFPWAVLLLAMKFDGQLAGQCGGTLITSGWIVSAAHCFYKTWTYDVVLANMGYIKMPEDYTTMKSIFQVIQHPQYNDRNLNNDIALLQLVDYVSFTNFITPICMPTLHEEYTMNNYDPRVTAAGWGFLKQNDNKPSMSLQKVDLDIISVETCRKYYSGPSHPITEGNMCTYTSGKDACQGDSGGGLYHHLPMGRWVQVGVVSWGIGCAQEGNPGVYTRIVDKLPWINTVINTTTC